MTGVSMGEIAYNDLFKPPVVTDTVTITTQPQDVDCYVGGSATLSIVAESDDETAILSYQWQVYGEDWTDIVDATSTSYSASTAAIGDTTYRCNVTSDKGGSATSETAEVSVSAQPLPPVDHITITTQPTASTSVYVSQTATLSVVAESDDPDATLYYQWQVYDGEEWDDIVGASSSTYTAPTSTVGVNTYRVLIASSLSGTATSDSATVTVSADTVSIITNPGDTQVYLNEGASVYCQASSNVQGASLAYQWQIYNLFDEEWFDISGATGYIYSGMDTSTVGSQQFRCVINSSYGGTATTTSATVTVAQRDTITITAQPQSYTGYTGDTVTLSVTATSDNASATLSYQWQVKNGSTYDDISGATSSTYSVPTSTAGTERYRVIVSSDKGASDVTSNYADVTLRASDIVTITADPQSTSAYTGDTVTLSVTASSDDQNATLSYAWQVYNTLHEDWDYVTGATSSTYSVNTESAYTATYRVVVTSNLGGTATSSSATVTITVQQFKFIIRKMSGLPTDVSNIPATDFTTLYGNVVYISDIYDKSVAMCTMTSTTEPNLKGWASSSSYSLGYNILSGGCDTIAWHYGNGSSAMTNTSAGYYDTIKSKGISPTYNNSTISNSNYKGYLELTRGNVTIRSDVFASGGMSYRTTGYVEINQGDTYTYSYQSVYTSTHYKFCMSVFIIDSYFNVVAEVHSTSYSQIGGEATKTIVVDTSTLPAGSYGIIPVIYNASANNSTTLSVEPQTFGILNIT